MSIRPDEEFQGERFAIMQDGHELIRNMRRPWDTAMVINKKWTRQNWEFADTEYAVFATVKMRGCRHLTLVSAHLPESWHHDDDCEAALEDIKATLHR